MPTKQETPDALDKSMAHWQRVWEGKDTDITDGECALCPIFCPPDPFNHCVSCPLALAGLQCDSVDKSPWRAALKAGGGDKFCVQPSAALRQAAAHMWMVLAFLREAEADE